MEQEVELELQVYDNFSTFESDVVVSSSLVVCCLNFEDPAKVSLAHAHEVCWFVVV